MLQLKLQAITNFEDTSTKKEFKLPIRKLRVVLGRGEELHELVNDTTDVLDLKQISNSVSRVHSMLIFSNEWQHLTSQSWTKLPKYLSLFDLRWQQLPQSLFEQIWQFVKPTPRCIFKDLHSRLGVFENVNELRFQSDLTICFAENKFMKILHKEVYSSYEELFHRLKTLQSAEYKVLNGLAMTEYPNCEELSFWLLQFRDRKYILLNHEGKQIVIGRSRDCDLVISDKSISRKHASFIFRKDKWWVIDGHGKDKSINGVWKKVDKVFLPVVKHEESKLQGQNMYKIGDLLMSVRIIRQPNFFNFETMFPSKSLQSSVLID